MTQFSTEEKRGLYRAIYERRDVRSHFLPDPVPDDVLARVLDAAHHAPSVGFMQPWDFIVIRDRSIRNEVRDNFDRANQQAAAIYEGEKRNLYDSLKLDGVNRYIIRFAPDQLPPVNAFWSLTMYDFPAQLMVANPLNRYLLNTPMLPQFKKDADGGFTLYFQNETPGADKEANWLPAPKGPFLLVMRLYWPKEEALTGKWKQPLLKRV